MILEKSFANLMLQSPTKNTMVYKANPKLLQSPEKHNLLEKIQVPETHLNLKKWIKPQFPKLFQEIQFCEQDSNLKSFLNQLNIQIQIQQFDNSSQKLLYLLTKLKNDTLTLIRDWKNQIFEFNYTYENVWTILINQYDNS
jgi:hypothetical protein